MPNEETNRQKFESLKNTQERMPANLENYDHRRDENQAFFEHNSIEKTKEEVDLIDQLLFDSEIATELELTQDEYRMLVNKKSLDQAHLLLNENSKEDSAEMKDVKMDVVNLVETIEATKNLPPTTENIDKIEIAYMLVADSCRYYLDNKNPFFKKGKTRKKLVKELYQGVTMSTAIMGLLRLQMTHSDPSQRPVTIGEFLGMKSGDGLVKRVDEKPLDAEFQMLGGLFPIGLSEKESKNIKKKPPVLSEDGKSIEKIFKEGYRFSEDINSKRISVSAKKQMAADVMDLYHKLKALKHGAVELLNTRIMGKNVRLIKKSDDTVYIVENHNQFKLEKDTITLCMQIEEDVLRNETLYGNQTILGLLDTYENVKSSVGEKTRIRTVLTNYISEKTNIDAFVFENISNDDLIKYVRDLLDGTKNIDQITNEINAATSERVFVNGNAYAEMMRNNENLQEEDLQKVVGLSAEKDVEEIEPDWTAEQTKVRNLIADLIYATDTDKMDLSISDPGKFMNAILEQHKEAMEAIANAKEGMVKSIVDNMSVSELEGTIDGQKIRFGDVLVQSINKLVDVYKNADGSEPDESALKTIKQDIDDVVNKSISILQENVNSMSNVFFPEEQGENNGAKKTLRQQLADTNKSTRGQGLFIRNVLSTYFDNVNNIDKRAMLSSVFRFAKNIPPIEMTDKEVIEEIQKKQLPKYKDNFKTKEHPNMASSNYLLSEDDKKAIAEYKEYKHKLRVQANYMAGLLRGAGPLMQKMMQGLPTTGLPDEIKEALSDMKSNLPPIPENVVKRMLYTMVESSNGVVTKIDLVKSLGAASVGQAFLCKVYGPNLDTDGKEVVIKLLRPDAKNRMLREQNIMLNAARSTDEAMYLTYQGQLANYKKELNLVEEAENCRKGIKAYGNSYEDVKTMTVFEAIPATTSALVVNKAEGVTLDAYIKEVDEYADKILDPFYEKWEKSNGTLVVEKEIRFKGDEETINKLVEKKNDLIKKVSEATRRREHLIHLCSTWIDQAMMKADSGFYHGDLHAGNIIINDDEATFIDYGNAIKLSENQQKYICQMAIISATSVLKKENEGFVDIFFDAFNELIKDDNNADFLAMYNEEMKAKVRSAFSEVLKMGNASDGGYRVMLCMKKAQELGVMLPPAMQNFSQGQIRLQNAVDELNQAIDSLKQGIDRIEHARAFSDDYDCMQLTQFHAIEEFRNGGSIKERYSRYIAMVSQTDKEVFKNEILDNTEEDGDAELGIKPIDKRKDFDAKYMGSFTPLKNIQPDELFMMGMSKDELANMGYDVSGLDTTTPTYRQVAEKFFNEWGNKADDPKFIDEANNAVAQCAPWNALSGGCLSGFGGYEYLVNVVQSAFFTLDKEDLENILSIYEVHIPNALKMLKKKEDLWAEQDKKDRSDERMNELVDSIYKDFSDLRPTVEKADYACVSVMAKLDFPSYESKIEETIQLMYGETTDGLGEELKKRYNNFKDVRKDAVIVDPENINNWSVKAGKKAEYKKAKNEFLDTYMKINVIRMKRYYEKMYKNEADIKFMDFDTVMGDVMRKYVNMENLADTTAFIRNLFGFKTGIWLGIQLATM